MDSKVEVTGNTLYDVKQAIMFRDPIGKQSMLMIDPISDFGPNQDHTIPTEKFRVTWNGIEERFVRIAYSVKHLNAIIKPIVERYKQEAELYERKREERIKKEHREAVAAARRSVKLAQDNLRRVSRGKV